MSKGIARLLPSVENEHKSLVRNENQDRGGSSPPITAHIETALTPALLSNRRLQFAPRISALLAAQRAIGNRSVRRLIHRSKSAPPYAQAAAENSGQALRSAGSQVLRRKPTDDSKRPPTPDPAKLTNPFDVPAVKVEVETLAVDRLRELTGMLVNQRYASYLNAIDTVARELDIKKKEVEEKNKLVVNAVLSIGLLAAGPAMAAIASEISGDALLTRLKAGVANNGPRWAKRAGIDDAEAAKYLTNDAYETLSSDTLKNLAAKFSAEKATKAVEFAADKLKDKTVELAGSTDRYACGAAYLESLKDAADTSSTELLLTLQGMTSYDELLGVYNAFKAMSLSKFREQVKVQSDNFMGQIAPLLAEKAARKQGSGETGVSLHRVNAYGKPRLVLARYLTPRYSFHAWITPDMEKTAISVWGEPWDLEPSAFIDLPDPLRQLGRQRIVKIDCWGALRLALIQVKDAGIISTELFYDFIRWIPDSERADMEARAKSTQIGGLMTLPAAEVKNLKQPTE